MRSDQIRKLLLRKGNRNRAKGQPAPHTKDRYLEHMKNSMKLEHPQFKDPIKNGHLKRIDTSQLKKYKWPINK